nr:acetyl-coA carboxylase beta subunit [Albidella oligococca]
MKKRWLTSTLSNKKLKRGCERNKSMYSLYSIGHTSENGDLIRNHTDQNIPSWNDNKGFLNVAHLFDPHIERLFDMKGTPVLISDDTFLISDDTVLISDDTVLVRDSNGDGDSYFVHFDIKGTSGLISDDTFLVKDNNGDSYFVYSDIKKEILEIEAGSSFLTRRSFSNTQSSRNNHINSYIASYICFEASPDSSISGGTVNSSDSSISNFIWNDSDIDCDPDKGHDQDHNLYQNHDHEHDIDQDPDKDQDQDNDNNNEHDIDHDNDHDNDNDEHLDKGTALFRKYRHLYQVYNEPDPDHNNDNDNDNDNDQDIYRKVRHLWAQCDNCYKLNYKPFLKEKMHICEHCEYHMKMSSSDRIELLVDPGTWDPINEDMVSRDPIDWDAITEDEDTDTDTDPIVGDPINEDTDPIVGDPINEDTDPIVGDFINEDTDPLKFHSKEEEEPYIDKINSYKIKTGLTEAVQTGIGKINGIPTAIGVMDFEFIGGSMGSVVGEKITRLIESASNLFLPLIIVCASGGARMQEGSLSLMQMAKISSALYDYQFNKKLFYVSILTTPTTGGVTASFGMLGDVIIGEPNAYIAFAGQRVIEKTLNETIPEDLQESEYLFYKGLLDLIVPRNLLKGVLSELFQLHGFFPLNPNSKN